MTGGAVGYRFILAEARFRNVEESGRSPQYAVRIQPRCYAYGANRMTEQPDEDGIGSDSDSEAPVESASRENNTAGNFALAEERERAEALAVRESQFSEAILESMPGILYFYDEHGKFLRWNRNFEQVSGYSGAEIATMHPLQFFTGEDRRRVKRRIAKVFESGESSVEAMFVSKNGSSRPYFFTGRSVVYEGKRCLVGVGIDIARRKDAEGRLEQLALYDTLTGLPNRQLMQDRLQHSLASSSRLQLYGALLFADLDDFKTLNDTHGHNTGDQLLQLAAERLQRCVREGDTVARFSGDEFVVILEALSANPEQAAALAEATGEQMLEVMTERYALGTYVYNGTMSIGVSLFRDSEIGVEELIRRADTAMHQAKRSGRNTL